MTKFSLHAYQSNDLVKVIRHYASGSPHVALVYCTGAGKTCMSLALASLTRGGECGVHFTHVVFAAPTKVIRAEFDLDGYVFVDGGASYDPPTVVEDINLFEYLASPTRVVIRLCHKSLTNSAALETLLLLAKSDPDFAIGKLLVIDEAHHAGELQLLSKVRDLWLASGGSVLSLTATPDGRPRSEVAIARDVPRVTRTLARQMAAGLAPQTILSEVLIVDGQGETDGDTAYAPVNTKKMAEKALLHMTNDSIEGPIKATFRLRNLRDKAKNRAVLRTLATTFRTAGLRVFVASDAHENDPEIRLMNNDILAEVRRRTNKTGSGDVNELLSYENKCDRYRASCVDVILGINEVIEGFNWKFCSHVYFIGVPLALLTFEQFIGRATRNRMVYLDYPAHWKNTTKIVLLTAGEKSKVADAHTKQMLSVTYYLCTFKHWSLLGSLADVFETIPFETPTQREEVADAIESLDTTSNRLRLHKIMAFLAKALSVFEKAVDVRRGLSPAEKASITVLYVNGLETGNEDTRLPPGEPGETVTKEEVLQAIIFSRLESKDFTKERFKKRLSDGEEPVEAARGALQDVIDRFKDETEFTSEASAVAVEIAHSLLIDVASIDRFGKEINNLRPLDRLALLEQEKDPEYPNEPQYTDPYTRASLKIRGRL